MTTKLDIGFLGGEEGYYLFGIWERNSVKVVGIQSSGGFFYFTFDDKFHSQARAHYCKLADINRRLSPTCPVRHLSIVMKFTPDGSFFPSNELTRTVLTKKMKVIACLKKFVKPHSLRIGGHTYYTVYGLDSDFRDYLARRKVKGATQTYYRASHALTIYQLRKFYDGTPL